MSLLWIEGVSNVTDGSNDVTINGKKTKQNFRFINASDSNDPGPLRTNNFRVGYLGATRMCRYFRPTQTVFFNFFQYITSTYNEMIHLWGDDSNDKCSLFPVGRGTEYFVIQLRRGNTVLKETDRLFRYDDWYHYEAKFFIDNVSGSCELRINGMTVLNETGLDLINGGGNSVSYITNRSADNFYLKNFIIYDNSGTINNDWMGPVYVDSLVPKSSGNFNDAINSSGNSVNNFDYVATRAPVLSSPTNYLSISGSGDKQSYFTDPNDFELGSSSIKDIIGFNAMHFASKIGTANIHIKDFVGYNGTYTSGNEEITTQNSYEYYYSGSSLNNGLDFVLHEINPHTSNRWQVSEITGLEFGYEITYTGI